MTASAHRYHLPKKAIKGNCPDCGPKHRRTLSRYIDGHTGEPLPEPYGRCDRESNCGFHQSPYAKGPTGMSYADQVYQEWKAEQQYTQHNRSMSNRMPTTQPPKPIPAPVIHTLPDEVFRASLGHYEHNTFAGLLEQHFGQGVATQLVQQFGIGTSSYWPGATVFWLLDEQSRVRGGQVALFNQSGHTVKRTLGDGQTKRCTSWVHSALAARYDRRQEPRPAWLTHYIDQANKFPVPFGLNQLKAMPATQAVALVESPKTAIICTPYFPEFVWMAIGSLSYLNAERLQPLRSRKLVLFPDLNAYHDRTTERGQLIRGWLSRAEELRELGYSLTVSDYLENLANDDEKTAGLDLADYLLDQWQGYPPNWDQKPLSSQ